MQCELTAGAGRVHQARSSHKLVIVRLAVDYTTRIFLASWHGKQPGLATTSVIAAGAAECVARHANAMHSALPRCRYIHKGQMACRWEEPAATRDRQGGCMSPQGSWCSCLEPDEQHHPAIALCSVLKASHARASTR